MVQKIMLLISEILKSKLLTTNPATSRVHYLPVVCPPDLSAALTDV